jgi:hypothetical protein
MSPLKIKILRNNSRPAAFHAEGFNSGGKGLKFLRFAYRIFWYADRTVFSYSRSLHYISSRIFVWYMAVCGPGSSVGIVTGYVLDGPGLESR